MLMVGLEMQLLHGTWLRAGTLQDNVQLTRGAIGLSSARRRHIRHCSTDDPGSMIDLVANWCDLPIGDVQCSSTANPAKIAVSADRPMQGAVLPL